eukprot:262008_1
MNINNNKASASLINSNGLIHNIQDNRKELDPYEQYLKNLYPERYVPLKKSTPNKSPSPPKEFTINPRKELSIRWGFPWIQRGDWRIALEPSGSHLIVTCDRNHPNHSGNGYLGKIPKSNSYQDLKRSVLELISLPKWEECDDEEEINAFIDEME